MDQTISTLIAAGVQTLAVISGFIRNEASLAAVNSRTSETNAQIDTLTRDFNARFETLARRIDRLEDEIRQWAKIIMQHNTHIARLKYETGLD